MRDKEIVGLYQAYLDVYSNSNEEVEQLDEDFPKQVGDFLKRGGDELKKRLPGVAKVLSPVGPGQGTVTASQQKAQIKPVGEEVEQLDELSSEVRARAKHKRMQNLDAAQRREMDARNVGATMGEISKRAEETSDASAKFSKHNQLSSRHARSRKRMNKEEVENWVNSLIEEGYDLSEYTWDDMYEMYVTEGRYTSLSALSRESQKRKEDKERGRPETQAEIHGRLAMGDFSPGASQKERARGGRQRLKDRGKVPQKGGKDMFEHILEHLVAEGYADTNESALAIMANMSEEWRESIVEAAADQSDKQIEKGVKTTYKAQNVLDNQHQGRSKGLNKLPRGEREEKAKRMRGRLETRRSDLFGERNKREDESRAELKKKYGL